MLVSYAQNFEDVMLWRALHHVGAGFYIDIGAQDPLTDSVSHVFYQYGWRGIHVEPSQEYAAALRAARPDELVIEAGIGTAGENTIFFEIPGTGLSTTDSGLADRYASEGRAVHKRVVTCRSLASILDEAGGREVHWLKIDVEGSEADVIKSWQPSAVRPWIVIVESTRPNSKTQSFDTWEADIIELGYHFCYFDGLNRFYLSNSHGDLKSAFEAGPNVFDGFALSGTANSPFGRKLSSTLDNTQAKLATMNKDNDELREELSFARTLQAAHEVKVVALESQTIGVSHELQQAFEKIEMLGHQEAALRRKVDDLQKEVAAMLAKSSGLRQDLAKGHNEILERDRAVALLTEEIAAIRASTSWRLSAPLRGFKWAVMAMTAAVFGIPRRAVRLGLEWGLAAVKRFPRLKGAVQVVLRQFPWLERQLRLFAMARGYGNGTMQRGEITWFIDTSSSASEAWQHLLWRK